MGSVEERLQRLEDERDILRTLAMYGHALDYGVEDAFMDCWTEDAVFQVASLPPKVGHDALRVFYHDLQEMNLTQKHFVVDFLVDVDGDRATAESFFARFVTDPSKDAPEIGVTGRYRDVLVRGADGRWRVKERKLDRDTPLPGG